MNKAFTLIEILITIAIIGMLTAVALPNLSGYKREVDYKNNIAEIESMITSISSMSKNYEQGVLKYKMKVEAEKISLIKDYGSGNEVEMSAVNAAKNERFTSDYIEFYCLIPGNNCYTKKNAGSDKLLLAPTNLYLDADLFLTLTDTNYSPAKISKYYLYGNPLKIVVINE
ncbi:MAG: prepilin-type N-terminal cleavage/methylation domain-containing protein [Patescibacteria group bacterium]